MKQWEMRGYNKAGQQSATSKASNLSVATESAQQWVWSQVGRSALIINRKTGDLKMRYWNDGQLQFLEF